VHEVDRRSVVNHAQARRLLKAVRGQVPSGPRLVAFYAVIYYAGLRPEEAVSLRKDNITLPALVRNDATGDWEEPANGWVSCISARQRPKSARNRPTTDSGATTVT
jgi:integrase